MTLHAVTIRNRLLLCLATVAALALLAGVPAEAGKTGDKDKKEVKKDDKKDKEPPPKKVEPPKDKTQPLLVLKGHSDWVNSVAYSHDGKWLITSGRDKTVRIWDAATGKAQVVIGEVPKKDDKEPPKKGETTEEKKDEKKDKGPPAKKEEKKGPPPVYPTNVKDAVFSPDSARTASSTGQWNKEKKEWVGEIQIRDVAGKQLSALHGHADQIESIAYSPDGKLLATGSEDQTAILWDLAAGKALHTLKGHAGSVFGVAFNKDGTRLATAGADKAVKVWEVATGKELTDKGGLKLEGLEAPPPPKDPKAKDPKKDQKKDPKGKDPKTPGKDTKPPMAVDYEMTSVAYSPDGARLAASNLSGKVRIWDAATGKLLQTIKCPEGVWSIAFSPDGKRMATGGFDDTIKVWDADTGKELLQRNGHERTVTGVAFSPDGQRLATCGLDGLVKIWPATPGK
jgi:WD40 repeat protein